MEDSQVTMSTILASRFVGGIRSEVEKVEKQLSLFSETLDEWVAVQKAWMYLEPIFRYSGTEHHNLLAGTTVLQRTKCT